MKTEAAEINGDGTTDEGSSKLPKCLVFQRNLLVGDFRKRTLSIAYVDSTTIIYVLIALALQGM